MRPKGEVKIFSLSEAVGKIKGAGDDDFMRMLVKLLSKKTFMNIPDWMTEITLENVEPSNFDPITCYSKLLQMRFSTYERHHPANVLEDLTLTRKVVFTVRKIEYEESPGKLVVLNNSRGLAMKEKKSVAFCAATSASLLAYYVRGKDTDLTERIKDEESNKMLGFKYANGLTGLRGFLKVFESSSTLARDEIYRILSLPENTGLNYHFSSHLATKFPKFYVKNDAISEEMKVYYETAAIKEEDRYEGALLDGIVPKVASGTSLESMWRYLDQSRSVRGQDSAGCGTLTVGYYWGWEISRSSIKNISMAWDIMNVLKTAGVKTVSMHNNILPVNVVSILINNGYYVVVISSVFGICNEDSKPGLYSGTSLPSIHYLDYKFPEPVIRKTWITYGGIPQIFGSDTNFFCYAYICSDLFKRKDLGFFPTTMPHQGRVIVSNVVGGTPLEDFIPRCIGANYFRNFYLLHRRGYWRYDPLASIMFINTELNIPAITNIKMAKGLLNGIVFEEPKACAISDDNEKLIVDRVDISRMDKGFRIASWSCRVTQGCLATDVSYLLTGKGIPSPMLQGLLVDTTVRDLLLSVDEGLVPPEEEEKNVPTNYPVPEGSASSDETENGQTNVASLKDITLPDNFE